MGRGPDWFPRKNARGRSINPNRVTEPKREERLTRQENERRTMRSASIRRVAFSLQHLAGRDTTDIPLGVFSAQAVVLHDNPELRNLLVKLLKEIK